MSLIRRINLGRRSCTAVPRRAEDVMSNPDCRATTLCLRVSYLIGFVGDLDTAAKYARLAFFTRTKAESTTRKTCQSIIGGMLREKRYKDAYDLYDFFFIQHKLRPDSHCCNYMIECRFQQGLVDEALDFHDRCINSGQVHDYPSEDTLRVLTKGLVHYGRLDQAEALLGERSGTVDRIIYPDHVAFNNLIRGFLDLGNLDKANLVLDNFKRLFFIALSETKDDFPYSNYENRVAFLMATYMEYWFKQGKEVEAMECYNRSVVANLLSVCTETANALLLVLLKYGQKDIAWNLYLDILYETGKTANMDSETVKIMVDECFDQGQFSKAMNTYNRSRPAKYISTECCEHETQKGASFCYAVLSNGYIIKRFCEHGMLSEAESVFVSPANYDLAYIDVTTFKTMIAAYVKAGRIDDAIKASNKMIDATLKEVSHLF